MPRKNPERISFAAQLTNSGNPDFQNPVIGENVLTDAVHALGCTAHGLRIADAGVSTSNCVYEFHERPFRLSRFRDNRHTYILAGCSRLSTPSPNVRARRRQVFRHAGRAAPGEIL